ncbi:MAG TPA: hypothetical protein VG144_03875 [Gaiellaceae bacterium]|nr:hypothetical protein [Gaiellaceae bacterium]
MSVTRNRPVKAARDRSTVGANSTPEMISRSGMFTLDTGIE